MNENTVLPVPTITAFELVDAGARLANVDIGLDNGIEIKAFAVVKRWNDTKFVSQPAWRRGDRFITTVTLPAALLDAISELILAEYERQTAVEAELDSAGAGS